MSFLLLLLSSSYLMLPKYKDLLVDKLFTLFFLCQNAGPLRCMVEWGVKYTASWEVFQESVRQSVTRQFLMIDTGDNA